MRIAMLGAGNVGEGLAGAAIRAGHEVRIAAAHPKHAEEVAARVGAAPASPADAARDADIVILAVPGTAVAGLADELRAGLSGKVVVDATNPLDATGTDLVTSGVSAAELAQQRMPTAKVVKAFNTVFAGRLSNPSEAGAPLDLLLAGDDADAKAIVAERVAAHRPDHRRGVVIARRR